MVECPRCNGQGYIYRGSISNKMILYICEECDACWKIDEDIRSDNFKDLTTHLMSMGIKYNQNEIEDLGYI